MKILSIICACFILWMYSHVLARYPDVPHPTPPIEPLPHVSGTVDVFPYEQASAISAGMDYRPRPSIQSFVSCDTKDANYLKNHGPDVIFFRVEPIDNHYPTLDDGACWPTLLSKYNPMGFTTNGFLMLVNQTNQLNSTITSSRVAIQEFNIPLTIPDTGLLWSEITIEKTLFGKLTSFIYKSPEISLFVAYSNQWHQFKLVPSMAKNGFLLSPFVSDSKGFCQLYSTNNLPKIQAFMLTVNGDSACYKPTFNVKLYQLQIK